MKQLQPSQPYLQLGSYGESKRQFILRGTDFERHKVISGITGAGKSFFLASIFLLIFRLGITVLLIDPNGDLAKLILTLLASSDYFTHPLAFSRLWYVDFKRAEKDYAIAFNVLKQPYEAHTTANNLLESMHRAFPVNGTTASLDNVILAASLVLIENSLPITQLPRLILDASFRDRLLPHVSDPLVVQFFKSKFGDKINSNLVDSTMRRSFLLTFTPVLRNTLGQRENMLNMRRILDTGISCIFNLGGLDDQSKRLLGGALLVNIEQAFLSRADSDPHMRKPAHIIIDEFPVFASHSEQSFAVILEQVRKYKGTLYLAYQTQSQLSSGMAGSLQNAVSINMKSGYADSSTLVQQFYRPRIEQPDSVYTDVLRFIGLLPEKEQSVFTNVGNTNEAKYLFETLQRQEAIVTLNGVSTLIKTNTIPRVHVDPRKIAEIEHTYATKLLTPLSQIEREQKKSNLVLLPSGTGTFKRRTFTPAQKQSKLFTLFTGDLEQDILTALSHFSYVTLTQLASLLGKEKSVNYLRKKLTQMGDEKNIAVSLLPRVAGGKPLQVYCAQGSGDRKQLFLEHTLDCTQALLAGFQVPHIAPSLTLVDLKDERSLKASAASSPVIPDGLLSYQTQTGEVITIALEIDRATENDTRISEKFLNYPAWIEHMGVSALTIAFLVTSGDTKRVSTLVALAKETLGESDLASLFLFAYVPGEKCTPRVFLDPVFSGLDNSPHALIEKPY